MTGLLAAEGRSRQIRVTPKRLTGHVEKLRAMLGKPAMLRRVREMRTSMTDAERSALVGEVEKLRGALDEVMRAVKSKT